MGLSATPATPATSDFFAREKTMSYFLSGRPAKKSDVAGVAGVAGHPVKSKSKNKRMG